MQLVVQEALERMLWLAGSYFSWLTPRTTITSSPRAGAEMMTFLAPPVRCPAALAASVKMPVDSTTMSTPKSPQGMPAGSRSASTCTSLPSMTRAFSSAATVPG